MRSFKTYQDVKSTQPPKLTIEDIDAHEQFRNLPPDQKLELILLIYDISLALYNSYSNDHE